jgi:hypothetical protein
MAGALTISTLNDSSGVLATQNGMTGIAKAWVNFGVSGGVVTVNNSFNVSSVTRSSTGRYSMTYTTAQANANYVLYASGAPSSDLIIYAISPFGATYGTNNTTTAFFTYINNSGPALVDPLTGFAAVFAS